MTIDSAIREAVLGLVPELSAAIRAELGREKLIPIKQAPIAYRAILAAEKAGELTVFRVGHAALVNEQDLFAWIKTYGVKQEAPPEAPDEIAEIVDMNERRRAGR